MANDVLIQCICGEVLRYVPPVYAGTMTPEGFTPAEAEREEGRREVLAEIAKLPAWTEDDYCAFCDARAYKREDHKPTCLWLRAQAVK